MKSKKCKKQTILMLVLTLLISSLSITYGESDREEDIYRVNYIPKSIDQVHFDYVEDTHTEDEINQLTLDLIRKELLSSKTLRAAVEIKTLQVPIIGQSVSPWIIDPMINTNGTSSTTIGRSGCNLTAHAAVASYMNTNRNYTPRDVNNKHVELLGQSVIYNYNSLTLNNFLNIKFITSDFIANDNGIPFTTLFFQSLEKIRLNRPIIIGYRYGTNYSDSHFVVVDGFEYDSSISPYNQLFLKSSDSTNDFYNENSSNSSTHFGKLRIMDPASTGSRKWVDSSYFNDKRITRIIMYQYK